MEVRRYRDCNSLCSNADGMRAAAILGPGNTPKILAAFQRQANAQWTGLVEQADAIVIFGGDGTIHHHLALLVDLAAPVLVVPCGSGNDFARALGLKTLKDSVAAWQKLAKGSKPEAIDLGVITPTPNRNSKVSDIRSNRPRYFCCVAGVGLDAEIAKRANSLPRWLRAHGGYAFSAPGEFLRFSPFPMKVSPNGNSSGFFQSTILAAVANAQSYGGGMKIAPQAKLDDGKLDVCVVRGMNALSLFCLFPTVFFGAHTRLRQVEYSQVPSVTIETELPFDVYADGEYVCQTPVEFSVAPKALQVVVA